MSRGSSPPAKKLKLGESRPGGFLIQEISESRRKVGKSVLDFKFNKGRVKILTKATEVPEWAKGIVYWMSRDQRVQDNWAMLFAQKLALKHKLPLHVCFCLVPKFLDATIRHFRFMLKGLQEVEKECRELEIPFHLLPGQANEVLVNFVKSNKIGVVVTDFAPLRVPLKWVDDVKNNVPRDVSVVRVDAHNVVPVWIASEKQEYAARTIRPKIHRNLDSYLTEFPPIQKHPYPPVVKPEAIDWENVENNLEVDRSVEDVEWAAPGTQAGLKQLESFILKRLKYYADKRNDPNVKALSNLSPWFHFGQISVQRAVLEVKRHGKSFPKAVEGFVEEAVVRRELADNFCFYNQKYDRIAGAYDWARLTLEAHRKDVREFLYTKEEFDDAKTHDDLWNAAQIQLKQEGKMHGFLRMYWAKKILEWTESPEQALEFAIYLNDRYNLDGRDPNGYVGCMWSICGIHDQGWAERKVFGKIRYMNYKGCKGKFDVAAFVAKYRARAYPYKKK
ncbi:unnamed protein product [Notodromas monacha]|uniref:Deoxyribodipyrimidine photo-lyase n=1 Tax=Notodromas monacha TaxID=399045 RepID=A0A7R9G9Z3_9CRUS|nr:unnamed protein product [Notodromas monacha]CAG0913578.1 unnamed protein product [Notodromas monacha]